MDIVRMIQRSYYRDDDDVDVGPRLEEEVESQSQSQSRRRPHLDKATGHIADLPLWRVGWVETPGRRNCLNVHEMHYTHMFERILMRTDSTIMTPRPLLWGLKHKIMRCYVQYNRVSQISIYACAVSAFLRIFLFGAKDSQIRKNDYASRLAEMKKMRIL